MTDENRIHALALAAREHELLGDIALQLGEARADTVARIEYDIRASAEVYLAWLRGPVRLDVTFGPTVNQVTKLPTGNHTAGGNMAQFHDDEQVDITVRPKDRKGFESGDVVQVSSSDESVFTVVGADDEDSHTATLVMGVPGTATLTVTDPTAIDPVTGEALSRLEIIEVKPAGATTVDIEFGTPVKQPAAPAGDGGTEVPPAGDGSTEAPAGDVPVDGS